MIMLFKGDYDRSNGTNLGFPKLEAYKTSLYDKGPVRHCYVPMARALANLPIIFIKPDYLCGNEIIPRKYT